MATDTTVNNLIINKLTKAQYNAIDSPSETELYLVPDEIDNVPTSGSDNPVKSGGVYTALGNKQDTLESGINIKTINEQSILGEGNIEIQSGEENVIEVVKVNNVALTPDANKAVNVSVPTALSQLNEDTTHRTVTDTEKASWNGKYSKPDDGIPSTDLANGVIPDVSNFVTKSVNDLVNYYTKTQTYTQSEVNSLIAGISGFEYEVVSTLPTASASTMHKIYLTPSSNPQTQNVKDEYITIQSESTYSWEQIGSTAIDLSGYVTTTVLNTALADYTTTADLNTLLAEYQTKIDATHKLDYSLLSNTPTKVSDFINDSGFITTESDPTVPSWAKQPTKPSYTASEVGALPSTTSIPSTLAELGDDANHRTVTDTEKASWNGKENTSNKVTSLSSSSTDTQYPSAKCVYDIVGNVEILLAAL